MEKILFQKTPGNYWQARGKSFYYAGRGIVRFFITEPNARIHLAASAGVCLLSAYFGITAMQAGLLIICVALVWTLEMINTAIEKAMNVVSTQYHPLIALVKDVAAGAVLVASVAAVIIALIIFIPKIITL